MNPAHDDPRAAYPLWVRLSLWGLPNRASVWLFFWLSTIAAGASLAFGVFSSIPWGGVAYLGTGGFLGAAALYFLAVRWVDRHGKW